MDATMLNRFFEKLSQSLDMQREFIEFAARHGIDFSAGELSGSELDGVAGGLSAPDLRSMLQAQQPTLQSLSTLSNISRLLHDMARSTVRNLR